MSYKVLLSHVLIDKIILSQSRVLEICVRNPSDLNSLYSYLEQITNIKSKIVEYSIQNLILTFVECIAHQKIQESQNELFQTLTHLEIALECARKMQEIYININTDYPLNDLVGMQEEALILTKFAKIEGSIEKLTMATLLFEKVRNETHDEQLYYLSMRNEAKLRLELAIEKINPLENSIKSIELSEKARQYFGEFHKYYKSILNDQLNATIELEKNESFGFIIENKKRVLKLLNKITGHSSINHIKLKFTLIELGIDSHFNLDTITNDIQELKETKSLQGFDYHRLKILEGDLYIKKAMTQELGLNSETQLNMAIHTFKSYRQENHFDKYYEAQSLYKEAYAWFLLFNKNFDETHLNKSLNLLNNAKTFYDETPFQNQNEHMPIILYYMALTKKEIYTIEQSLKENYAELENLLLDAITYFEKRNNFLKILKCYLELGKLFYEIENYKYAFIYLNKGITIIESMRNSIIDLNIKEQFFDKISEFYELMIETCYNLKDKHNALKFVEMTKQRLFLDKIINNQINKTKNSMHPELIKKLKNIEKNIVDINTQLDNFENDNFSYSQSYKNLLKNKEEQNNIIQQIKCKDPKFYNIYFNNIFDYSNINLEDKTLIEYYYNEESLFIFLINKTQFIMKKAYFKNKEQLFHKLCTLILDARAECENLTKFNDILSEFYKILIKPIENLIKTEKLIIIPYRQLHNVPFNGLYNEDYLIEKHEITIVQSASLVKYLESNDPQEGKTCSVIGNPTGDLKNAEIEAKHISNKLNTEPLIFKDANKKNVLKSLENNTIIHYAGHGNFNFEKPLKSSLKLNDEDLTLKDLENKSISSELIVLSSCETGLVSIYNLDENRGFVNYLQINGARFIIAPLWSINSKCCELLFNEFYDKKGEYSSNLRNAQLKLKKTHNLYSWGAFQIYGL